MARWWARMAALAAACATRAASGAAPGACEEAQLKREAGAVLAAHFDVEFGAVAAGDAARAGFQHLKPADAMFAAQALAHDDFPQAAAQFQNVLKFQHPSGLLPHMVYGPSVPADAVWIDSNRTYHPGPAFWASNRSAAATVMSPRNGEERSETSDDSQAPPADMIPAGTSAILAPPVAADTAWQIFRLAPYDAVLGVVSYQTPALQFLCNVYEPLKRLQTFILTNRTERLDGLDANSVGRVVTHHPWETFSGLSRHWKYFLARLKKADDYTQVVNTIPAQAKERFAAGAIGAGWSANEAIIDLYEPMIYLASTIKYDDDLGDAVASFSVADVEFNSLVLRSAQALVNIAHILADHSSVCTDFSLSRDDIRDEIPILRSVVAGLQKAIIGGINQTKTFWNETSQFFNDVDAVSPTSVHSLRQALPAYASELGASIKLMVFEHFLSRSGTFDFFCSKFSASFFACSNEADTPRSTWTLYNYFVQRAFTLNGFPGVGEFLRNKTRDMVCEASRMSVIRYRSAPTASRALSTPILADSTPTPSRSSDAGHAVLSLVYDSETGRATPAVFDDTYIGSTLAAAAFLNILLPAVTAPPSPDKPPVDHRMLTVIMCVELVVAFGVALSCVLFSVYFVVNRPRDGRASSPSRENGQRARPQRRRSRGRSGNSRLRDDSDGEDRNSMGSSWYSDERASYSSVSGYDQVDDELEEALLSDEDEHAYGSIEQQASGQAVVNSMWGSLKDALHAISPW